MELVVFIVIIAAVIYYLIKSVSRKNKNHNFPTHEVKSAPQNQASIPTKFIRNPDAGALQIHYTNASQEDSIRIVDRMHIEEKLLIAYCHLRGEVRNFRLDRIKHAVDINTGEVIEDIELFLMRDRPNKYFLYQHKKIFQVLFYIGKVDGRFDTKQKAIMHQTVAMIGKDPTLTKQAFDAMIRSLGEPISPREFRKILKEMASAEPNLFQQIYKASKEMVAVKKEAHVNEIDALNDFDKIMTMNGLE